MCDWRSACVFVCLCDFSVGVTERDRDLERSRERWREGVDRKSVV